MLNTVFNTGTMVHLSRVFVPFLNTKLLQSRYNNKNLVMELMSINQNLLMARTQ